jgi:integrase
VSNINGKIAQANGRLKASSIGITIELRGDRLWLRGTLPPKPDSHRQTPYQQRISLGYHANAQGLKLAEAEARKIGALVACKEFQWEPYLKSQIEQIEPSHTISTWVERFEQDYFSRRSRSPKSETTWSTDYLAVFSKLPSDQLTAEILTATVLTTEPDTRTRKRYCIALGALAKFAQLGIDLKPFSGSYSPSKVTPRDLPDDRTIVQWYYKIGDRTWQWVYGMLATYGLRPHEIFHLSTEAMPIATVLAGGKTGHRKVWACFPEWVEQFDLFNGSPPSATAKNNTHLGAKVNKAFKRIGIPFQPYDLRHAWAIRTLEFGLDISLAAQQMGHSVQVHSTTYHQWITHRHHQRAYEALMMRPDRPRPPTIDDL